MPSWKSKLFGDTRLNFWGWLITGAFIIFVAFALVSAACVLLIYRRHLTHFATPLLLIAIFLVLVGQFGLALQNYYARVVEHLDSIRVEEAASETNEINADEIVDDVSDLS